MSALVLFRHSGGLVVEAVPGDVIGRSKSVAVHVNDPRVSEAHALVSLRGSELRLLALRGRFAIGGNVMSDVVLAPGLTLELVPKVDLYVVSVDLPEVVLGIEGPKVPLQVLPPVASLYAESGAVIPGFAPNASAVLWTTQHSLHVRVPGAPDKDLSVGATFAVGAHGDYRVVSIALATAACAPTLGGTDLEPLVITLRFDTVHIARASAIVAVDGLPARLLSELGLIGVPIEWRTLARLLWAEEALEDSALRGRFDRVLNRLRQRLREVGLRSDLVRTDGSGRVELLLGPNDRVKDEM